jgi:hypothetical protein
MKMKLTTPYILSVMFLISLLTLLGCSSGRTTTERKEGRKEEITVKRDIKNIELEERNYIKKLNIKSADRLSFDLENGKPSNRHKLATITYNKEGFPVETINYDPEGKPEFVYTYKYDKTGKRTETIRSSPAGVEEKKFTYVYNEFGNKTKSERYDMLGNLEKYYEYRYDDEGNLVEDLWYDKSGKLEYKIEYSYDGNGRKTRIRSFNESNRLVNEYELLYDNKGNLVEELKIDPSGEKTGIIQYIYQYF